MAEAEQPERVDRRATLGDIRQITAGATPHFALQLRARIQRLIAPLAPDDPVRPYGVEQCALLEQLAVRGEFRGEPPVADLPPLPSVVFADAGDASAASGPGRG
jgi:hypothetical protein